MIQAKLPKQPNVDVLSEIDRSEVPEPEKETITVPPLPTIPGVPMINGMTIFALVMLMFKILVWLLRRHKGNSTAEGFLGALGVPIDEDGTDEPLESEGISVFVNIQPAIGFTIEPTPITIFPNDVERRMNHILEMYNEPSDGILEMYNITKEDLETYKTKLMKERYFKKV